MLPFASTNGKHNGATTGASKVDVDNDPAAAEHYEKVKEVTGQPVRKRQKIRNHCVRFWLCYLIGSIALLAITLPLL